jgi:hypothetical protein
VAAVARVVSVGVVGVGVWALGVAVLEQSSPVTNLRDFDVSCVSSLKHSIRQKSPDQPPQPW